MLKKLLKYNLKNQFKFFGLLYGLIIFNAVAARLLSLIDGAPAIVIFLKNFCAGAMWAMIVNAFVNNILRVWHEARRSIYGDESYLMHTLPVKSSTIYWSKFIGALTILIANVIVSVAGVLIAYADTSLFEFAKNFLEQISSTIDATALAYIILLGAILLLELFNIITVGFLAMIMGHRKNNNKVGWSVGLGFVLYAITQVIVVAVFAISGIFNSEMFGLFNGAGGSSFDPQTTKTMFVESCFVYIAIVALTGVISAKKLNRGFDID